MAILLASSIRHGRETAADCPSQPLISRSAIDRFAGSLSALIERARLAGHAVPLADNFVNLVLHPLQQSNRIGCADTYLLEVKDVSLLPFDLHACVRSRLDVVEVHDGRL